ncbi:hypothetical protein OHT59_40160 [Streptomyces sp. NBC_00243]|uniref:hypothetical protein n=1 Tax=Streptomyces sp. NBC_00243 TaxID=2975688 RepID=UPI002DDA8168|nr:hypothetical protein [Streptomyces sp. NBC_00243]WRZ24290.1 hypothetical protein OHT59_40160 [Streptomyces sp. NBC_00243]
MSNDAADGTRGEQPAEFPLTSLGLIGALARALDEHQTSVITPQKDAPKAPLIKGFAENRQSDLVVQVAGQDVGKYKVNLTRDRFVVDDEAAFDQYAEEKGEIDVIIVRREAWEKTVLAHAEVAPETGLIFDPRTGEAIPGVKFLPGGKPTGTVTWTWKTRKGQASGKAALLAAWRRGDLNDLLRETPELMAGSMPAAEDA